MKLDYHDALAFVADMQADDVGLIQSWLDRGTEPTKKLSDDYPNSPMQLAAMLGATRVLKHFIDMGVDVNKGVRNWSPLMEAVQNHSTEAARMLLDAGADPNLRSGADDDGDSKLTALMMAAEDRDETLIRMLLDVGADPTALSNKGRSAVTFAISGRREKRMETVRMLLEAGCPAAGACLVWPAEDADIELIRVLAAAGADPNEPSNKYDQTPSGPGVYPIHLALMARWWDFALDESDLARKKARCLDAVRELIRVGADVNLRSRGLWVLREDSIQRDREVLEVLTAAGWTKPEPDIAPQPQAKAAPTHMATRSQARSGARDFLKLVFRGHPEWSVLAVEAPIQDVAEAFTKLRKAKSWTREVPTRPLGKNSSLAVDEIPVVQMIGSSWTVLIRSLFDISSVELHQVPEEAQALSEQLNTRAVTFMGEDTSSMTGMQIYEGGALVEKQEWYYDRPADARLRKLGVYVPFCFAESDGEQSWVTADKRIIKEIERADLVNL